MGKCCLNFLSVTHYVIVTIIGICMIIATTSGGKDVTSIDNVMYNGRMAFAIYPFLSALLTGMCLKIKGWIHKQFHNSIYLF